MGSMEKEAIEIEDQGNQRENASKNGGDASVRAKAQTVAQAGAPLGPGSNNPKQGMRMTGAQAVIASLEAEGVDILFGYPGGQVISIYDALYDSKTIKHVLARHEQAAVHEADGYARSTGRVGVVLVTSGPGATNTVTGIATAYMDSVPLVIITGQVPRSMIGTDSFQESDIVGITMPIVKHSYLLQSVDDLARTFREAFHIAKTGRPGPVLIDIPSDVARQEVVFKYPDSVNIPSYRPTYRGNAKQIRAAVDAIGHADRPVILAGGGVAISHATSEVLELSRIAGIPVVHTLMGKGAIPDSYELSFGMVGMHGSKYANMALNRSDLIIACGVRFSDRVTGNLSGFAKEANVIHIDIDPAEIGKIREAQIPIVGDLKNVLDNIVASLSKRSHQRRTNEWLAVISEWKHRYPIFDSHIGDNKDEIVPELAFEQLSKQLDPLASIVTTEVGQHQMWAAQTIEREVSRSFISSGGLGTMGFGFPAAIGAQLGNPNKTVVCIAGDGSFQMNSQEMATATIQGLPIKVIVVDNRTLGMVHQWQKLFYDQRYSHTELDPVPDFVKLAVAYGWEGERVSDPSQIAAAFRRMLEAKGPYLIDLVIESEQNVFPMVAPGKALADVMGVTDLDPGAARNNDSSSNSLAQHMPEYGSWV